MSDLGDLLPSQKEFITSTKDLAVFRGGLGSGKSRTLSVWGIMRALQGRRVMLLEPTYGMVNDILIPTIDDLLEMMGISGMCRFNRSNRPELYLPNDGYIALRSCENPDKLRGPNLHDFGMDEPNYNKSDEAYKIMVGRTRLDENAQHRLTGTPKGNDWVHKLVSKKDAHLVLQSTLTNPFLPKQYRLNVLDEYGGLDSEFARQELLGEIVSFNNGYYLVDRIEYGIKNPIVQTCQAFDLAFTDKKNSDFTAYALCGVDSEGKFIVIHAERWKFKAPDVKRLIKNRLNEFESPCMVEANGPQVAIYQDLTEDPELYGKTIIPYKATTSKVSRSVGFASAMSAGKVVFNKKGWNSEVADELASFTLDDSHEHDDYSDAIVMCYNFLKQGHSTMASSELL